MLEYVTVAQQDQIPVGEGRAFEVHGRLIAVFRSEEGFTAIDDACSHMGASLAAGYVENGGVYCPWHAWKFCTKSGEWLDNPGSSIRQTVYPVRIVDAHVQVGVEQTAEDSATHPD